MVSLIVPNHEEAINLVHEYLDGMPGVEHVQRVPYVMCTTDAETGRRRGWE